MQPYSAGGATEPLEAWGEKTPPPWPQERREAETGNTGGRHREESRGTLTLPWTSISPRDGGGRTGGRQGLQPSSSPPVQKAASASSPGEGKQDGKQQLDILLKLLLKMTRHFAGIVSGQLQQYTECTAFFYFNFSNLMS